MAQTRHSTSLGVPALSVFLSLCGVLGTGLWLGRARSFPKSGKTQMRQQQTLEIPGEQAGVGLQSAAAWPVAPHECPLGPPEDVGCAVLATACFPGAGEVVTEGV